MQLGCSPALTSALAFICVLVVLGILLAIPFGIARLRGVNATLDRLMDKVAEMTGAASPSHADAGNAQRPAPKQFLRSLQVTPYAAPSTPDLEAGAAPEECCICFAEYEPGVATIELSCRHRYHKRCILAWLHVDAVCPICKAQLLPDDSAKQEQPSECDCPQARDSDTPADAAAPAPAPAAPPPSGSSSSSRAEPPSAAVPAAASAELGVALAPLRPHAPGAAAAGVAGVSP